MSESDTVCEHMKQAHIGIHPRTPMGCEECLQSGESWVHLRLCLSCGHVGCCDSSKNRHATRHFQETGHPVVQAYLTDDWVWCYLDQKQCGVEDVQEQAA